MFQSAMRMSLNYGQLPSEEESEQAFKGDLGEDGVYEIRNCRELEAVYSGGNVDFDCDDLWTFLESAVENIDSNHECGDLASDILFTLGIEWV